MDTDGHSEWGIVYVNLLLKKNFWLRILIWRLLARSYIPKGKAEGGEHTHSLYNSAA